jgi:hypothetical protein
MSPQRIIADIMRWRQNLPNLRKESGLVVVEACVARTEWLMSMEESMINLMDTTTDNNEYSDASRALIQIHLNNGEVGSLLAEYQ